MIILISKSPWIQSNPGNYLWGRSKPLSFQTSLEKSIRVYICLLQRLGLLQIVPIWLTSGSTFGSFILIFSIFRSFLFLEFAHVVFPKRKQRFQTGQYQLCHTIRWNFHFHFKAALNQMVIWFQNPFSQQLIRHTMACAELIWCSDLPEFVVSELEVRFVSCFRFRDCDENVI